MTIPITHLERLEQGLVRVWCEDQACNFIKYFHISPNTYDPLLTQIEDIVAVQSSHYQSHIDAHLSTLRLRFRGQPDVYTRSGNKRYDDPTRSHKKASPDPSTTTLRSANGTTKLKGNRDSYNPFPGNVGL